MLGWIKNFLYKKRVMEPTTIEEKIDILLRYKIDIKSLYHTRYRFLFRNIFIYKDELKSIISQDLSIDKINYIVVEDTSTIETTFLYWLSKDGEMPIGAVDEIRDLCNIIKKFYLKYKILKTIDDKHIVFYNVRILELHLDYIYGLIDTLSQHIDMTT